MFVCRRLGIIICGVIHVCIIFLDDNPQYIKEKKRRMGCMNESVFVIPMSPHCIPLHLQKQGSVIHPTSYAAGSLRHCSVFQEK
jgi:hypothetical protein